MSLYSDISPVSDIEVPWGVALDIEDAIKALEELKAYKRMVKSPQELRCILADLELYKAAEEERKDY